MLHSPLLLRLYMENSGRSLEVRLGWKRGGKHKGKEEKRAIATHKTKKLEEVEAMVNYSAPDRSPRKPYGANKGCCSSFMGGPNGRSARCIWASLCSSGRGIPGYSRLQVCEHLHFFSFFRPISRFATLYHAPKQSKKTGIIQGHLTHSYTNVIKS